jgi:hypothetical protein
MMQISDWKELEYLKNLPRLKILWLRDNPLCRHMSITEYRRRVISILPNLSKLDEHDVTHEEKEEAKLLANKAVPRP